MQRDMCSAPRSALRPVLVDEALQDRVVVLHRIPHAAKVRRVLDPPPRCQEAARRVTGSRGDSNTALLVDNSDTTVNTKKNVLCSG